jgi:SAM-dependent methyltransferase
MMGRAMVLCNEFHERQRIGGGSVVFKMWRRHPRVDQPVSCIDPDTKLFVSADRQLTLGPEAGRLLQHRNDMKYLTSDGVVRVDRERWDAAQSYERGTWMADQVGARDDRNEAHAERFQAYAVLDGRRLPRVIELGCGPFTNARLVLPKLAGCEGVTLLDPLVDSFLEHPHCTYASGDLCGVPVTTVASSIEDFEAEQTYDLLILVNVLEHCFDVPRVFDVITSTLRHGGILVFGESMLRPEDVPRVVENWYDTGHPIRLSANYVTAFLHGSFSTLFERVYEGLYSQTNRIDLYFIGERA